MANSEIPFQTEIINAVRDNHGFAYKLSNAVLVGVCDLELKLDLFLKIECKFFKFKENFTKKTMKLTAPQDEYLRQFAYAQGYANIWIGFKGKITNKTIFGCKMFPWKNENSYVVTRQDISYANENPIQKIRKSNDGVTVLRFTGEPWPIKTMVELTPNVHKEEP